MPNLDCLRLLFDPPPLTSIIVQTIPLYGSKVNEIKIHDETYLQNLHHLKFWALCHLKTPRNVCLFFFFFYMINHSSDLPYACNTVTIKRKRGKRKIQESGRCLSAVCGKSISVMPLPSGEVVCVKLNASIVVKTQDRSNKQSLV